MSAAENIAAFFAQSRSTTSAAPAASGADSSQAQMQTGVQDAICRLARLQLAHDTQIRDLESTLIIAIEVHCPTLKKQLVDAREAYNLAIQAKQNTEAPKQKDKDKDQDKDKAQSKDKDQDMDARPSKDATPSLRSICHLLIFQALPATSIPEGSPVAHMYATARNLTQPQIDGALARFKPQQRNPLENKPWEWRLWPSQQPAGVHIRDFWQQWGPNMVLKPDGQPLLLVRPVQTTGRGAMARAVADILPPKGKGAAKGRSNSNKRKKQ
eukprot:955408-Amphidinium_carterae.1